MSGITTHVLDVSTGRPAVSVRARLELEEGGAWRQIGRGATNQDGRLMDLVPEGETVRAGRYRLTFDTGVYFARQGVAGFYPEVQIQFEVERPGEHYHVPLLLSPFGYSTYRGS